MEKQKEILVEDMYAKKFAFQSLFVFVSLIGNAIFFLEKSLVLNLLFFVMQFASLFIVFMLFLRKFSFSRFDFFLVAYYLILLTITIFCGGELRPVIFQFIGVFGLTYYLNIAIKEDTKTTLFLLSAVFSIIIYINCLLMFFYPEGIWEENNVPRYLLGGNYNQFGPVFICGIVVNVLYSSYIKKINFNIFLLFFICFLSLLITRSMTTLIGMSILVIYLLFFYSKKYNKVIIKLFFIIYLILLFAIVFFRVDLKSSNTLSNFTHNVLNKNLTFSGRTYIWKKSIDMIQESPVIGYGYHYKEWWSKEISGVNSHNFILQLLLNGGFLLLGTFIVFMGYLFIRVKPYKDKKETVFLKFAILTLFFMMLMEVYPMILIMFLSVLLANVKYISE